MNIRQVWVRKPAPHVPAHRIPIDSAPAPGVKPALFVICCPPYLMDGGTAITLARAAELEAFPCLACFPRVPRMGWPR